MLAYFLAAAAGAAVILQAGANGTLAHRLGGPLGAALISFAVGTCVLGVVALAARPPFRADALGAPWWAWSGGFLGAFYVAGITSAAPRIGAAMAVAILLAAQMSVAVALDHWGLMGFARHPAGGIRLAGLALIAAGVALVKLA